MVRRAKWKIETVEFKDLSDDFIDFGDIGDKETVIIWYRIVELFQKLRSTQRHVLITNFPVQKDFYLNFMSFLGNPVPQDILGTIIAEVANKPEDNLHEKRGHKSNKSLAFHNDRCDIIGLLCCSKAESGGLTILVDVNQVQDHIKRSRPDLLKVLESEFFFDLSDDKQKNLQCYKMPIFMRSRGQLIVRYIRKFIDSAQLYHNVPKLTTLQIEALNYLDSILALQEYQLIFHLEKGDLLLINNFATLHSRTEFYDSTNLKRLLYRIWLSNPKLVSLPDTFKPFFGDELKSPLRGGFRSNNTI